MSRYSFNQTNILTAMIFKTLFNSVAGDTILAFNSVAGDTILAYLGNQFNRKY